MKILLAAVMSLMVASSVMAADCSHAVEADKVKCTECIKDTTKVWKVAADATDKAECIADPKAGPVASVCPAVKADGGTAEKPAESVDVKKAAESKSSGK